MWEQKEGRLYRKFEFKDFRQAFDFMEKVAQEADHQNHHPKWSNEYNKVEIWLSTHSAGDTVTDKDKALAKQIDRIYENTKV